jgi:hypothetical protein
MSAFGRGRLLGGMNALALMFAASLAFAGTELAPGVPILSPEAPVSFGDLAGASPLLTMFTGAPATRGPGPDIALFAEPNLDLARAIAPEQASAAFVWNRHREDPRVLARGDAAIQESPGALRSPGLLRFARNDDRGSTKCEKRPGNRAASSWNRMKRARNRQASVRSADFHPMRPFAFA